MHSTMKDSPIMKDILREKRIQIIVFPEKILPHPFWALGGHDGIPQIMFCGGGRDLPPSWWSKIQPDISELIPTHAWRLIEKNGI